VLVPGGSEMKSTGYKFCGAWRVALIASTLTLGACDAVNELADELDDTDAEVHYYVSLGTSLSVGVQPNGSGVTLPTDDGYADQLFDSIKTAFNNSGAQPRELRLIKLGCPGETLDDLVNGGPCLYVAGSQLEAAVDFLTDNRGKIHLVTIDIGGNDFRNADCIDTAVHLDCASAVSGEIATGLAAVLASLRDAAGPDTTIVGVNYYNPYLSSWLDGPEGQVLAVEAAQAAAILMDMLGTTYATAGMPLADVAEAFQSDNFDTLVPTTLEPPNNELPISVANICEFTYQCDSDRGPDIHANTAGYALIAETIEAVLP
jgi:lysophospholipase L1-like esterase